MKPKGDQGRVWKAWHFEKKMEIQAFIEHEILSEKVY